MHWNRGLSTNIGSPSHPSFFHRQGLSSHPRKTTSFFGDEPNIYQRMTQTSKVAKLTVIPERTKTMEVAQIGWKLPWGILKKTKIPWFHRFGKPATALGIDFSPQFRRRAASRLSAPDLFPLEASSVSPWSLVLGYTTKVEKNA